jgi:hypothetical protein
VYCYSAIGDRFYNCAFLAHGDLIGAFPYEESNFLRLTESTTLSDVESYVRQPHPACLFCSGSDYRKRIFVRKAAQVKAPLLYRNYPR